MLSPEHQFASLENTLRGDHYGFIISACERVQSMGGVAEPLVPALCDCLDRHGNSHYGIAIAVTAALGSIKCSGDTAVPALIRALECHRETHYGITIEVAKALGGFGELGARALPILRATLERYSEPAQKHFGVLRAVSDAMIKIDPDQGNDAFVKHCWEEGVGGVARFEGLLTAVRERFGPSGEG